MFPTLLRVAVTRRRLVFAWMLSVALHIAIVVALRRFDVTEPRPRRAAILLRDVQIVRSEPPRGELPAHRGPAPSMRPARSVAVQPPPTLVSPSRALDSPGRVAAASDFWKDRSLAAFLEACAAGEAPRDSLLDRPEPPPQEIAVARTLRQCNEAALNLRAAWNRERFAEEYQRNFPNMR